MGSDLISVIIPAYNAEKWLTDCCRSVFSQTWPTWEIVIVDDGSTDETLTIAEQLADGRENVRVIHTDNRGVSCARNTGLDVAKGAYIVFLDADDLLPVDALERLHILLVENDGGIAIGWKTNMTSDGKDLGCPYERMRGSWTGTQGLEMSLRDHPATYAVWGKLYRRDVVADVRFAEGRRVHEDSFFLFQCMMKQPKVLVTEDIVLHYRISENSASRSFFSDKFFDILYFAERKRELIEREFPQYRNLAHNMLVKAHMALLQNLCNTADPKYRQAEKNSIRAVIRNKAYFVPATDANRRWFFIITHRFYRLYKRLHQIRHPMK